MVSPFLYMPVWWNGIHSGLRNRGESMRVRISPQVLNHVRIAERYRRCTKDAVGKPVEVRILLRTLINAGLVELVYTAASNTAGESHKGSTPLSCI